MRTSEQHLRERIRLLLLILMAAISPALLVAQRPAQAQIDARVNAMMSKLTLAQKIELIGGVDGMFTHAMPQIGLPRLKMSDGPVGVRTWGPTTGYAAGIGLAASWDVSLARRIGVALGHDARARGVNFLLGPGVNIYREPMDGRNFEFFGEDPYLASRMAVNYVEGLQSQHVVATIKHFVANNAEFDRHGENVIVDERTLHEIYLPAFEAAVREARVGAVMDSYNLVNGEHMTENKLLDTTVLKKEWGFRGILMSDWSATYNGVDAANAGLDLEMPRALFMNAQTLLPAIKAGTVSIATLNDKVRRILRVAVEFGFVNHNQTDLKIPLYSQSSRATALQSAEESIVLLKNQGHLLPLNLNRIHTIALIGPDAYPAVASAGGSAHVTAFNGVSELTGLSNTLGTRVKVLWNPGVESLLTVFGEGGYLSSAFTTDAAGTHPGLTRKQYAGGGFTGAPVNVATVMHLNSVSGSPWAIPSRVKKAYRYTGYYTPRTAGPQRFIAAAIGGDVYSLYVNHKLVLKETPHEGQSAQWVDLNLPVGKPATVRFDYLPQSGKVRAGLGALPAAQMLDPQATKIASLADVVILSVGFDPYSEGEGHDRTFRLPPGQADLIRAVVASNPHTVVVITSGGAVATRGWINQAPAVIESWYGGSEAGHGLAAVLLGRVSPSGKLPISWERRKQDNPCFRNYYERPGTHNVKYAEGVFMGYRYYDQSRVKPLFPFGYGLSYTTFAFSHLRVSPAAPSPEGPITVTFSVSNTGHRAAAEVAEVYVGDPSATVRRPVKELKRFDRVFLNPGQTKQVSVTLHRRSLAYWDVKSHGWKVDPGKFLVYVGDSSENVPLQAAFTVR